MKSPQRHEQERTFALPYERSRAMSERLLREGTGGGTVTTLGDGFFRAETRHGLNVTMQLGRIGPDTRFVVRVEPRAAVVKWSVLGMASFVLMMTALSYLPALRAAIGAVFPLVIVVVTLGVVVASLLRARIAAKRALSAEVMLHATFRAIEDGTSEQGVAAHYRVAPGMDAVTRAEEENALREEAEPDLLDDAVTINAARA